MHHAKAILGTMYDGLLHLQAARKGRKRTHRHGLVLKEVEPKTFK